MDKNQDKGFTLIELLIVIVILGILAAVTVFAVTGITDQGQTSACDIEERTLVTASEAYYAQNSNTYPVTEAELNAQLTPGASDWTARFTPTWGDDASPGEVAPTFVGIGVCAE